MKGTTIVFLCFWLLSVVSMTAGFVGAIRRKWNSIVFFAFMLATLTTMSTAGLAAAFAAAGAFVAAIVACIIALFLVLDSYSDPDENSSFFVLFCGIFCLLMAVSLVSFLLA